MKRVSVRLVCFFIVISILCSVNSYSDEKGERLERLLSYFPKISYGILRYTAAAEYRNSAFNEIYQYTNSLEDSPAGRPEVVDILIELQTDCDYFIFAEKFDIAKWDERYAQADPAKGVMPPPSGLDERLFIYELPNAELYLTERTNKWSLAKLDERLNGKVVYSTRYKHHDASVPVFICAIEGDLIILSGSENMLRRMAATAAGKVENLLVSEFFDDINEYIGESVFFSISPRYLNYERRIEVSKKKGEGQARQEAFRRGMMRSPRLDIHRVIFNGNIRTSESLLVFFSEEAAMNYANRDEWPVPPHMRNEDEKQKAQRERDEQKVLHIMSKFQNSSRLEKNVYIRTSTISAEDLAGLSKGFNENKKAADR